MERAGEFSTPQSTPATAAPAAPTVSAEAVAAAKSVPTLGYSTQTLKTLNIDFQYQQTGYWCGPAATRIALSARISPPSQQQLANELPTTTNGTDWNDSSDMTVLIADPAGFAPTATCWLTFNQLATLIPPKGYSA